MAIHKSRASETARLVTDVLTGTTVEIEAATARLIVLGARSIPQLRTALAQAGERRDDTVAARLLDILGQISPGTAIDVVSAADAEAVGPLHEASIVDAWHAALTAGDRALSTRALDRLTALTLEPAAPRATRVRALAALRDAAPDVVAPLVARVGHELQDDRTVAGSETLAARALDEIAVDTDAGLAEVRAQLATGADTAPLSVLHRVVTRLRAVEATRRDAHRQQVAQLRAAVHQALARRDSTVALYDLRDSFERDPAPLPVGLFAAIAAIGDGDSLEALAAAWLRMSDDWSRTHITEAAAAIIARHALGPRHAAVKRARAKCAELIDAVSTPSRSTPSRPRARRT